MKNKFNLKFFIFEDEKEVFVEADESLNFFKYDLRIDKWIRAFNEVAAIRLGATETNPHPTFDKPTSSLKKTNYIDKKTAEKLIGKPIDEAFLQKLFKENGF